MEAGARSSDFTDLAGRSTDLRWEPELPPSPSLTSAQPCLLKVLQLSKTPPAAEGPGVQIRDPEWNVFSKYRKVVNQAISRWTQGACHRSYLLEDVPSTHVLQGSCQGPTASAGTAPMIHNSKHPIQRLDLKGESL